MGKKRRVEAEDETQEQKGREEHKSKKGKHKETHPSSLTDRDLEDKERELHEALRQARWEREKLRTEPPAQNRIAWQRQVTSSNNVVHKAESLYNEARNELDRRRGTKADSVDSKDVDASTWHSLRTRGLPS
mmetsp:Transcript_44054/g.126191  ORF Transcript_44054/g.126191 Transcript_44054/m.126191 type:complete len:132 (-) Transcript_44054:152-547(-)|eukprot:CAMPEP_0177435648 /NCGR_PEP_ID=MMETSP0369-20130122/1206_1 /TAXON_ID=447022 ORGANISM="Scrippsiella hangoei-like, Strain SHHI-4" /NCGR_SAMPLE_ID=MMETSP0369 /ASSEMBLY_ACC=CAM_ASM_000364 /LENGTH=131 /DNA_ID=CAMNT_0018906907 /DNA_START=58 /DNA_END=453 /DNA_ORIENTATION=-